MHIPNHISESFEKIFWAKILKFFDPDPGILLALDPGRKRFGFWIWDKHPRSATLVLQLGFLL
jgi:hypothetical protein